MYILQRSYKMGQHSMISLTSMFIVIVDLLYIFSKFNVAIHLMRFLYFQKTGCLAQKLGCICVGKSLPAAFFMCAALHMLTRRGHDSFVCSWHDVRQWDRKAETHRQTDRQTDILMTKTVKPLCTCQNVSKPWTITLYTKLISDYTNLMNGEVDRKEILDIGYLKYM